MPVVAVFIVAGLQVPVMPLLEIVGNAGAVEFWHSGPICVNTGAICDETTISIVVIAPHCPAFGVNVYVVVPVVEVLITAGFHVPVIPLLDVVGNVGAVSFWHSAFIWVNIGVI